ncbi:MAG: hypothetical protein J2P26_08735 [Nocardiopsaceae bacterium]|nr:hypothetical protein [Nocardiopsaceae bacterium]
MQQNEVPDSPRSRPEGSGSSGSSSLSVDPTFDALDRVYLEKLALATDIILRLGEDDSIPAPLESELHLLRDRIERALLG